jgi:hypothetical protein
MLVMLLEGRAEVSKCGDIVRDEPERPVTGGSRSSRMPGLRSFPGESQGGVKGEGGTPMSSLPPPPTPPGRSLPSVLTTTVSTASRLTCLIHQGLPKYVALEGAWQATRRHQVLRQSAQGRPEAKAVVPHVWPSASGAADGSSRLSTVWRLRSAVLAGAAAAVRPRRCRHRRGAPPAPGAVAGRRAAELQQSTYAGGRTAMACEVAAIMSPPAHHLPVGQVGPVRSHGASMTSPLSPLPCGGCPNELHTYGG